MRNHVPDLSAREDSSERGHLPATVDDYGFGLLSGQRGMAAENLIKIRRAERGIVARLLIMADDAALVEYFATLLHRFGC